MREVGNPKRGEYWRHRESGFAVRIVSTTGLYGIEWKQVGVPVSRYATRENFSLKFEPYPEYPADRDEAVNRIEVAREAERIALDLAKEQGKRLWAETRDKYRPAVSEKVQEALALGVPKSRIQRALGSKNFGVVELYAEASKN